MDHGSSPSPPFPLGSVLKCWDSEASYTTSATKVDDVAVVWAVGTDTGRDRNLSVLSSHSLQLFQIFSEVMIVAQV